MRMLPHIGISNQYMAKAVAIAICAMEMMM